MTRIGWLVICGWMAILAGNGYLCGTQIEAVIQLNNPSYVPQRWEGTLLFWATVLVAVLINTVVGQLLPPIEALMLVVHVLGFFAVLIPLVYVRLLPLQGFRQGELNYCRWRLKKLLPMMFLRSSPMAGHGQLKACPSSLV